MIKIGMINRSFKQKGNVCVIASYGIVIEYFSKKRFQTYKVISKFIDFFPDLNSQIFRRRRTIKRKHRAYERQQMIYNAFIDYCQSNGDKRGYEFICELHINDNLRTEKYCKIVHNKSHRDTYIERQERLEIREKLKSQGLAMVLYPIRDGSHSIVIGVDKYTKKFIVRDPARKVIIFNDFLENNDILEYIYFIKKAF